MDTYYIWLLSITLTSESVRAICPSEAFPIVKRNYLSEIECSSACLRTPGCASIVFQIPGSCTLFSNTPRLSSMSAPPGNLYWVAIQYSKYITRFEMVSNGRTAKLAHEKGFNVTLRVGNSTIFLKKIDQNMTHHCAEVHCLTQGGILPMEDSEEFIAAMSDLVDDPTTPRFVSLVTEHTLGHSQKHATWTLGQKEWGEDEDGTSCPKYSVWSASQYSSRCYAVNPVAKTYEPIPLNQSQSNGHCQYLGPNLAKRKKTIASSTYKHWDSDFATDGIVLDNKYWHANVTTPSKWSEWIAVDLGTPSAIQFVMFLARNDCCGERIKDVHVWVGSHMPRAGTQLDHDDFLLCGVYPYQQQDAYLSGVTCTKPVWGQVVALENFLWAHAMTIVEIGIFGVNLIDL